MPKTRAELESELRDLDASMETLKKEHPDDTDFWPAFAGMLLPSAIRELRS